MTLIFFFLTEKLADFLSSSFLWIGNLLLLFYCSESIDIVSCNYSSPAHWLHHWPSGRKDQWDPSDVRGSDQDCQPCGGLNWQTGHHYWLPRQYQPGRVPDQCPVRKKPQASAKWKEDGALSLSVFKFWHCAAGQFWNALMEIEFSYHLSTWPTSINQKQWIPHIRGNTRSASRLIRLPKTY